ncbi:hypothetical protein TNCV_3542141 [Trichonephila clavipes]|nr:hypothetical protein TNCV_3542141 [Trichonephila clavipes]
MIPSLHNSKLSESFSKSKGHTRLDTGHNSQSLQDCCRLKTRKFFQTQQQSHEEDEELLSANVIERLMPSRDPEQMLMLRDDLPGDSPTCLELIL